MRTLYVEDSPKLLHHVARALQKSGMAVDTAADGETGLEMALTQTYDVIVLDVMLPKLDGINLLRTVRENGIEAGIIMLTAKETIEDRINGLNHGADDYLVKPFAVDELLARIQAVNRRRYGKSSNRIEIENLAIDTGATRVFAGEEEVSLRPREYEILCYLMCRAGETVSRFEILDHVYDHASAELKSNAIDAAVCTLRKKLSDAGATINIRTIPRRGYLIDSAGGSHT